MAILKVLINEIPKRVCEVHSINCDNDNLID